MRARIAAAAALAIVGGVVTWLVEPNLILGLRSGRAIAWVLLLASVCLGVGAAAYYLSRRPWVATAAGLLPAVVATGVFVVGPILNPRTLDEALPGLVVSDPAAPTASANPAPDAAPPAAAPVLVAAGELRGLAGHDAKGRVATYRLADGSHLVRFEQVDIGGTPAPYVYVVPGADQRRPGGVSLGKLKAEKGSFHYALPSGLPGDDFTVLVWCEQFAVEIANATQA